MANYATLKAAINAVIKTNGNKEITGQVLNQTLMAIVDSLGENYQFAGVAVPSTNPGTPDQNIFYLATQAGTYTNFGATVLPAGISFLEWNGSWSSETLFTIDDAPTEGSGNLVKSGGVKIAIDNVAFSTNEKVKDVGITDTLTSGSDSIITSGAVFDAFKNDGGSYDVSVHFPTGGVEGGNTYTLDGAIAKVPQNIQKGGMSIKFIQSSDNKYVQYRLMADEWSTSIYDWASMEGDVIRPDAEWVEVHTDSAGKILYGVKADGKFYFGDGCPPQVKDYVQAKIDELSLDEYGDIVTFLGDLIDGDTLETLLDNKVNKEAGKSLISSDVAENIGYTLNPDYIETELDSEGKLLSARKEDGTLVNNTPTENPLSRTDYMYNTDWLDLVIDLGDRIIEGTTKDGKKYIGEFADDTIVNIGKLSSVIKMPELNADFVSPVDVTVTGTKGDPNAKYEFRLHLDDKAFNIRFKFRLTENILNQNKSAVIAKLGNSTIVKATSIPLVQETSTVTYQGQTKTNYWPCLANGISFIGSLGSFNRKNNNIGHIAFSIKYSGSESIATIQNTGTSFILKIGETTHTFDYTTYPTVSELYEAIKAVENISVGYRELNHKNCTDIAIFPECNIKPTMYTGTTGQSGAPIVEYVDTAEFMVPYAVDDSWHYVEVVKINDTIYRICDGESATLSASDLRNIVLTLGGECGVVFNDLEIHTNSAYDAEVVNGVIISSFNPYLIVYEGHGIDKVPSTEATVTDNMNTTIDRLEYVFSLLRDKGYVPVSVKDIAEWYNGNKELPKRCYTIIFDDFRFDNVLDIDNRSVFTRFGVKPALAIISDRFQTTDIYHNGVVISDDKAVEIANMYNFDLIGHTRNHRYNGAIKPSDMINELTSDVYANELCGVNGEYFVFPYGSSNPYMFWCMKWLGYYLGFNVWNGSFGDRDTFSRSKYNLVRYEIGMRENMSNILIGIK